MWVPKDQPRKRTLQLGKLQKIETHKVGILWKMKYFENC